MKADLKRRRPQIKPRPRDIMQLYKLRESSDPDTVNLKRNELGQVLSKANCSEVVSIHKSEEREQSEILSPELKNN